MIQSDDVYKNRYTLTGAGGATQFDFDFEIQSEDQIQVILADEDDTQTTLVLDSDYTVTINEDGTGYITFDDGDSEDYDGYSLTLTRLLSLTQLLNLVHQGAFSSANIETALDYLTLIVQSLQEQIDRCIKVSVTSGEEGSEVEGGITSLVTDAQTAASAAETAQAAAEEAQAAAEEAAALAAGVSSFNSRTGIVVPAVSDYDASQVDNDSDVSGDTVADALDTLNTNIAAISSLPPSLWPTKNLQIVSNGNTQIDVSADVLPIEGVSIENFSGSADITVEGLNGLDAGSEANSAWYYIWAICDANAERSIGVLLSTATTKAALTLPESYVYARIIGNVYNDDSGNFLAFTQTGNYYQFSTFQTVSNSATATANISALSNLGNFELYAAADGSNQATTKIRTAGSSGSYFDLTTGTVQIIKSVTPCYTNESQQIECSLFTLENSVATCKTVGFWLNKITV